MVTLKKVLIVALVFCLLLPSLSCTRGNEDGQMPSGGAEKTSEQKCGFADVIPEYERLVELGVAFEHAIIFEGSIDWLFFSPTDYDVERAMVKEYEKKTYDYIAQFLPNSKPIIHICKYDFDQDGQDEIVAFLHGSSVFSGTGNTGLLVLYFVKDGVIEKHIMMPSFLIDISKLENSKQIGVIKRIDGMPDLLVLNRLCIWEGSYWKL
jgi:hypothetical protein